MANIQTLDEFLSAKYVAENHIASDNGDQKSNKFTIVCVSVNSDKMYEIEYLRNACLKCDTNFIHVNFTKPDNFVKILNGSCILYVNDKMYELDKASTLIVKRHAKMGNGSTTKNLRLLSENDFLIVNSTRAISVSSDKAKSVKQFMADNVSHPKSLVLDADNFEKFDEILDDAGFTYPVIAKVNRGSQGNGVFLFDTPQSLKGVAQYIITHQDGLPCSSIVVQEKIDAEYDLRIHVLRKESDPTFRNGDHYEVFAAMKRNKIENDYRSNASLGAEYEYYEPAKDEIDLAIKAARSMECVWCGVDIMRDKHTKQLYVLEVNCTPSLKGITKVAKKDPAYEFVSAMKEAFVGHISSSKHKESKTTLGYKETFYINDFETPLIGLLDTGNGSLTSLRVKDIKVDKDDNTVEWTLFDKKFKTKYDGEVGYISSGGGKVYQPTTRVDLTHNGITYKNIRIKLSDIESVHNDKRVLNINRNLMTKMNVVIDSSKKQTH